MGTRFLRFGLPALLVSVLGLALAIACGSSDTAEPAAAAPTPDVARIIQDAVNAQGASASSDIEAAVAAALAGQEGLTRADVEAIVNNATAGGLSAADVQRIVDQSIQNIPVPQIDTGQLSALVQSAVAASAPEGIDVSEINRMVQAAVSCRPGRRSHSRRPRSACHEVHPGRGSGPAFRRAGAGDCFSVPRGHQQGHRRSRDGGPGSRNGSHGSGGPRQRGQGGPGSHDDGRGNRLHGREDNCRVIRQALPHHLRYLQRELPTGAVQGIAVSAAAVAAGTILPVDERLPNWENVFILPPGDEIGVYGGSLRTTMCGQHHPDRHGHGLRP